MLDILNVNPEIVIIESIGNVHASKARTEEIPMPRNIVNFLEGMNHVIIANIAGKNIQMMDEVIAGPLSGP